VLECKEKYLGKEFNIINLYGPYGDRKIFRDNIFYQYSLRGDNVIFGGDLKLTMKVRKIVWGRK